MEGNKVLEWVSKVSRSRKTLPAPGLEQMRTAVEQVGRGDEGRRTLMGVMVQEVGKVMLIVLEEEEDAKGLTEVGVVKVPKEVVEKVPEMMAATGGVGMSADLGEEQHPMVREGEVGEAHRDPDVGMTAEVA